MKQNDTVLNGRYTLVEQAAVSGGAHNKLWEVEDKDTEPYTLKITPYDGDKPSPEVQLLWNNDLRVMYRLSSSPGADRRLVVMKDAGIDATNHAMVLVYEGSCYVKLSEILKTREQTDWFSFKKLKEHEIRRDLWCALLQLAKGLKSLHDQNLIHRNINPDAIWGKRGREAESLRLSGFDWSARIGHETNLAEHSQWSTPPELKQVGYSFASDWYGFGTTIARCFYKIEHLGQNNSDGFLNALAAAVSARSPCSLEPLEQDFIKEIIAAEPIGRLKQASEILNRIETIIEHLEYGRVGKSNDSRVLLYFDLRKEEAINAAEQAGFRDNEHEIFDPNSPEHTLSLKEFIVEKLQGAQLRWQPDGKIFQLACGDKFFVRGEQWRERSNTSWQVAHAYLDNVSRLRESLPPQGFNGVSVEVTFDRKQARNSTHYSWDEFAPRADTNPGLGKLENLQQFFHISNQLEILLRDAELFKYRCVDYTEENGTETIRIAPVDEDRPSRKFFQANKTLVAYLQQEREATKPFCDYVFLTESDSLYEQRDKKFQGRDWVEKAQWKINDIDQGNEIITLFRKKSPGIDDPPKEGYLRTRGHYGQIRLIERRKHAIDRLASHVFLLKTMAAPGITTIDAGANDLPCPQVVDGAILDQNKLAIIKDILRVRPMYALQGPPGTGKSTLVAHLLRQILEEDPMAQILVTSKDHAAVDVLLEKVMNQAYASTEQTPLAIRLSRRDGKDGAKEQADKLLKIALDRVNPSVSQIPDAHRKIQHQWHSLLKKWHVQHEDGENQHADDIIIQELSNALTDLVRRGASITYCTTSSGDLEELSKGTRSFDWSIVEEAGKTHGFDLALPLQAGHRWLLLGDQSQLRPFLYDEFDKCFKQLKNEDRTGAIDVLEQIAMRQGNNRIIDVDWFKDKSEINGFANYAASWLPSFKKLFEYCLEINGETREESIGSSAGSLIRQYRMSPVVGTLISNVFYKGMVENATAKTDGTPDVGHENPFIAPPWLTGKSLIWLDTPHTDEYKEERKNGYSNPREQETIRELLLQMELNPNIQRSAAQATIAILTPYNWQKVNINNDKKIVAPAGCQFGSAQGLNANENKAKAYSVDSFQGDEADIVIVSFVRNRPPDPHGKQPAPDDIRFITQADRLNVMFSRARRLLIIVGCWDYLYKCAETISPATNEKGDYIEHEYGPFKKMLEELKAMFTDGRAVKISASEVQS